MKVQKIIQMKQDVDLDIIGATLLSGEEYREVKDIIPKFHHPSCWWLRKPFGNWGVGFVNGMTGELCTSGNVQPIPWSVRPVLEISNIQDANLQPGDRIVWNDQSYTIINDHMALCDSVIGECAFRLNSKARDTFDYRKSTVKKYVDDWFSATISGYKNVAVLPAK